MWSCFYSFTQTLKENVVGLLGEGDAASLQNYWWDLPSPPPPRFYAYVNLKFQRRIKFHLPAPPPFLRLFEWSCWNNKKYCDKTVDAQVVPHLCIWRESARALTHVRKQIMSMICHKKKQLKMIKVVTLGEWLVILRPFEQYFSHIRSMTCDYERLCVMETLPVVVVFPFS